MFSKKAILIVSIFLAFVLAACNLTQAASPFSNLPTVQVTVPALPTMAALPTSLAGIPTELPLPQVTLPPVTLPTVRIPTGLPDLSNIVPTVQGVPVMPLPTLPGSKPPTATPTNMMVKIFLIAQNDNGASGTKIGCNDSVVGVNVQAPYSTGVLRAALTKLLSVKGKDYGESGLYNALYQSNLSIESLAVTNGEAVIKLSGQMASGGVCDDPRIIAQIEQTALQFSTVKKVTTYVNGQKIQDLLSGK